MKSTSILRGSIGRLLGITLLLTAIVGSVGAWYVRSVAGELSALVTENLHASISLSTAERALWKLRFALPNYTLADTSDRPGIKAPGETNIQQVNESIRNYEGLPLTPEERTLLEAWHRSFNAYLAARPHYFELVDAGKLDEARDYRARVTNPPAADSVQTLEKLIEVERSLGRNREVHAKATANTGSGITIALVLAALGIGALLSRSLAREIGEALRGLKQSSADLEATAMGLLSGARELSVAATQISTTLEELLTTSRQISESTRGVASIATETGTSAQSGDEVAKRAQESLAIMRARVDDIVHRMGALDRSSREIDGVVDVINELSEQTNILSVNATIEAVGAGQAGLRFGTVADEIRRLADRVGKSARGIRELTSAVHESTAMTRKATEDGERAVEASTRQFREVLETFQQIAARVGTTTTATREIEASTRQQTTAVAQVNAAMTELVRAAKDTELSSQQMTQTCAELRRIGSRLGNLTGTPDDERSIRKSA